jgi:hypothetical protein
MSKLTDELLREHSLLVSAIMAIGDQLTPTPATAALLGNVYRDLKKHMAREETEVYGRLAAAAVSDPGLRRTLAIFVADTAAITRTVLAFFEKHQGGASPETFAKEYRGMFLAFRTRIRREEEILFKALDRLADGG